MKKAIGKKNEKEEEEKQRMKEVEHLDHINGLDDAGGEHSRGAAINKGLDSGPNAGRLGLLIVSH